MRAFYTEAGLDADGDPYVLERGWAEDDHVLPVETGFEADVWQIRVAPPPGG